MNWSEFLLSFLEGKSANLSVMRRAATEGLDLSTEDSFPKHIDQVLRTTLARLKHQGFIARETGGIYRIVRKGYDQLKKLRLKKSLPKHTVTKSLHRKAKYDTVVVFDIPEKQRRSRGWLRSELRSLGFALLQKSTWIGSGPIPKDFIVALKELNILTCVHIFAIKKSGTLN